MNIISKFSLYDIVAMVIPGFTILLVLTMLFGYTWTYESYLVNSTVFWIVAITLSYIIGIINEILCRNLWGKLRNNTAIINEQLRKIKEETGISEGLPKLDKSTQYNALSNCICMTYIFGMAILGIIQMFEDKLVNLMGCKCCCLVAITIFILFYVLAYIVVIIKAQPQDDQGKKLLDDYYNAYYYVRNCKSNSGISIIEGQVAFLQNMFVPIGLIMTLPCTMFSDTFGTPPYGDIDNFYCMIKLLLLILLLLMIWCIWNRIKKIYYLVWSDYAYQKRLNNREKGETETEE